MNRLCPTFAGYPRLFIPAVRAAELGLNPTPPFFCHLFFFFFFGHTTQLVGSFLPQPETEPWPMAMKAPSPNHWTARGIPGSYEPKH